MRIVSLEAKGGSGFSGVVFGVKKRAKAGKIGQKRAETGKTGQNGAEPGRIGHKVDHRGRADCRLRVGGVRMGELGGVARCEVVSDTVFPPFRVRAAWGAIRARPRHGVLRMKWGNVRQKGGNFGRWGLSGWWRGTVGEANPTLQDRATAVLGQVLLLAHLR